jgi:hypothetical protein
MTLPPDEQQTSDRGAGSRPLLSVVAVVGGRADARSQIAQRERQHRLDEGDRSHAEAAARAANPKART